MLRAVGGVGSAAEVVVVVAPDDDAVVSVAAWMADALDGCPGHWQCRWMKWVSPSW